MSSSRENQEDVGALILAGSDEAFDNVCQPCRSENLHVEAVYYCENCAEFLCDDCCKTHNKLAATRHHTVLDKSAIAKTKPKVKTSDVLTETCPKHAGKLLEFFCNDHRSLCCSVCLALDHSACSNKSYVPDVSVGFAESSVYQNVLAELDRLLYTAKKQQERFDGYKQDDDALGSKDLSNIKEFRRQINELLDKLEASIERRISSLHAENSKKISHWSCEIANYIAELNTIKSNLTKKEKENKNNQLLVSTEFSRDRIATINCKMAESSEFKIAHYYFHRQKKRDQFESMLSDLWSLFVREGETPTKARYVRQFSVKSEDDTEVCNICDVAVLTGGRVVVSDYNNKAVKLIDMKLNKIISRLPMSSQPFGIIEMMPNKLAIALGNEEKIQIISVSDSLFITNTIKTSGARFSGLCYDGTNFITASASQRNIKIIDMTGSILSTISTDNHGQQLFTKPRRVAFGRNKNVVYVTDREANKVTCMTTRGLVLWVYTHDKLKYPLGVAVGQDGSVYVCSRDTHTVHQLSATGILTRIILSQDQGLTSYPDAMSYDENAEVLYISSNSSAPEESNYIRLYQLE